MALEPKDLELIERIIYKNADDIAVSISRSFERLQERIDAVESRLYGRMSEVEDKVELSRQDTGESITMIREEFRDALRDFVDTLRGRTETVGEGELD